VRHCHSKPEEDDDHQAFLRHLVFHLPDSSACRYKTPLILTACGQNEGIVMHTARWYSGFAKHASHFCGRPTTFALAVAIIAIWVITGPIFAFSDTWQLVINTGTTIITFLMVFLIQNTQNRDTEAIQIKLDELIRATNGAHNALLDLEELEEDALDAFRRKYQILATSARENIVQGNQDTGTPEP
jgi:low affinity Fe/Cu permease